ncbi:MAG: archease [Desulfobacteraceae bacterium]|nr:archease [Desulfobacteraceae bacterium]
MTTGHHISRVPYRVIEHTADTGFELTGASLPELFANAALALCDLIWEVAANPKGEPLGEEIRAEGGDPGELMVNFLQEFLYLYDAKGMVATNVEIAAMTENALIARVRGHRFEPGRDEERLGVKAVTYHQLFVGREDGRWRARVILDI